LKLLALGKARWGKGGGEDELFEPPNYLEIQYVENERR
jgi:hypothetical protein